MSHVGTGWGDTTRTEPKTSARLPLRAAAARARTLRTSGGAREALYSLTRHDASPALSPLQLCPDRSRPGTPPLSPRSPAFPFLGLLREPDPDGPAPGEAPTASAAAWGWGERGGRADRGGGRRSCPGDCARRRHAGEAQEPAAVSQAAWTEQCWRGRSGGGGAEDGSPRFRYIATAFCFACRAAPRHGWVSWFLRLSFTPRLSCHQGQSLWRAVLIMFRLDDVIQDKYVFRAPESKFCT